MNNSSGPMNSSGNWWSIIKAYNNLNPTDQYRYTIIEEIINSIDNEEVQYLLTEVLDFWDGKNLTILATGGFNSGGTEYMGQVQENRLTVVQSSRMNTLQVKVRNGTITPKENEEYEKLVSMAGYILQEPQAAKFFTLGIMTPDKRYKTQPTMVTVDDMKISFGNTTLSQFLLDLEEVLLNAKSP